MTLPLNSRLSALYDTNGTQKDFGFGFRVFFDPDNGGYGLEVRVQTEEGYDVIPKSSYIVLPIEDNTAGIVRFHVAPDTGQQIYIAGKTPTIQQLVLTNFGRYSAESIESQFDFITAIIQEWASSLDEEVRQRIAGDVLLKAWVYEKFPDFAQGAFDVIFQDFYSQWQEAIDAINRDEFPTTIVYDPSGKTQNQINIDQAKTNIAIINYVSPKMFGGVGDGIADDSDAVQACFNFMLSTGATLSDYSNAKYKYTRNITVSGPGKTVSMQGNCEFISDNSFITISGTLVQVGNITSAATKGSKTISLSSVSGLSAGDILLIQNARTSSFSTHRTYYYDGEIKVIDSVSSLNVTIKESLETSYPSGVDDKVFKMTPVKVTQAGNITFTGNAQYGLRVLNTAYSSFNCNAQNLNNAANSQAGMVLSRGYMCDFVGGNYIKLGLSPNGTDYGLSISNSQDIKVRANYCYGYRHGVTMGGDDGIGSIPCRRIFVNGSKIENSPGSSLHAADMHGNTINCEYSDNVIFGRISLSGKNTRSRRNKIHSHAGDVRAPIGYSEVVGGRIESIEDEIIDSGSASFATGWLASSTASEVNESCSFVLQDIKINANPSMVGITSAINLKNTFSVIIDGFDVVNAPAGFNRAINYSAGSLLVKPTYLQVTRPKIFIPESFFYITGDASLPDVQKRVFSQNGSTANGKWIKKDDGSMDCRHRIATTIPITTAAAGGFISANIQWTYPKAFIEQPTILTTSADNSSVQIREVSSGTSSAQLQAFSTVSIASAGVNFNVVAMGKHLY